MRYATIALLTVLLAVWVVGCDGADAPEAAPTLPTPAVTTPAMPTSPQTEVTPTATATPTPTPDPTPDPDREARLEELRASNAFLEFAEADRARTATWARLGYDSFAPHRGDDVLFEWSNKQDLWNSIAPGFRDECLLAGPPAVRPMWNTAAVIPAAVSPRWTDESTGGRGQFVEFVCTYIDKEAGEPTELWAAALIATDDHLVGEVVATMPPFTVPESDHDTSEAALDWATNEAWQWIISHPAEEANGNA